MVSTRDDLKSVLELCKLHSIGVSGQFRKNLKSPENKKVSLNCYLSVQMPTNSEVNTKSAKT